MRSQREYICIVYVPENIYRVTKMQNLNVPATRKQRNIMCKFASCIGATKSGFPAFVPFLSANNNAR